VRAAGPLASRR